MSTKIAVIGGGSWGTSLAFLLADKGFNVTIWVYEKEVVAAINDRHENTVFLPGVKLSPRITAAASLEESADGAEAVLFVVPSHVARPVLMKLGPCLSKTTPIVSATKGIENETLLLMSQVMEEVLPAQCRSNIAVLSGPSFAKEVCQRHPTAVSLAAKNHALAVRLQPLFITPYFKAFTTTDVIGVQLGGALKNVIALAAGGADGLGFGHNTRAALISRGLAEIIRLGSALGADPKTFSGLSGLGDLILTSTGALSRNRTVGYQIGLGMKLPEILKQMKMVAEGVQTTKAAYHLAKKHGVRMPIVQEIYSVLFEDKDTHQAVTDLMESAAGDEVN
ncbi:MAG: NAD(P)H-dependent glycerol-3-phosphate dehydrogenase [Nitrospirae bacterium]|nr:NAD(P)H-dependent glycerol-3-phosphate dehydrogenase [Nitrospirota bacterium]